jgi:hypothetical protein
MKVTPAQLDTIRTALAPLDTDATRAVYRAGDFPRAALVQNLDKRYRWDLLHAATAGTTLVSDLYDAGCHDAHIDTALRAVVAPL